MKTNTTCAPIWRTAISAAKELGYKRHGRTGDWNYGPGKFEGTDVTLAYWYQAFMDGSSESLGEGCEAFDLNAQEREAFGCKASDAYAVLTFSESGFVDLVYLNQRDYDRLLIEIEQNEQEQD